MNKTKAELQNDLDLGKQVFLREGWGPKGGKVKNLCPCGI